MNVYQRPIAPLLANSNQDPSGRSPPEIMTSTKPSHQANAFFPVLATLPSDVRAFILIPVNQFEEVKTFLKSNPGFLDSSQLNNTMFDNVAAEAAAAKDDTLLKQCIQRRIIVRQCRTPKGYDPRYLNRLIDRDGAIIQDFSKRCTQFSTSKTATGPASTVASKSQGPDHSYNGTATMSSDNYASGNSGFRRPFLQPSTGSAEDSMYGTRYPVSRGPYDTRDYESGVQAGDSDRRPGDSGPYDARGSAPSDISQRQRRSSHPAAPYGAPTNFAPMYTPGYQQNTVLPGFRTTEVANHSIKVRRDLLPDPEPTDSRFRTRNGRSFFIKGQVFAMMFPEPKGVNPHTRDTRPDHSGSTTYSHGQDIFSHRKRFVVIRQREGYCLCIPINSYQGTGVGRKGIPQKEKRAHAIIYDNKKRVPRLILPGEDVITKKAIAVDLEENHTLDETSRIHFGKVYTIEWNVKVMRIGQVASASEKDVEDYWREEMKEITR